MPQIIHHLLFYIVFSTITLTLVSSANILDFLWEDDDDVQLSSKQREESGSSSNSPTERSCACNGSICTCCVDFNLTYIDLGGPGCVQLKYISQAEGLAVNVSYGESLLHSEQVKGPNPEPTCMSLLVNLAEVCARFSDLRPHNDGLRGCLLLEPKLLGDVTASFNIGCFTMDPQGMRLEESNSTVTPSTEILSLGNTNSATSATQNETESSLNEEELIAVVNESAEQGLTFFGNLLGFAFGKPNTNDTEISNQNPSSSNDTTSSTLINSENKPTVNSV